MKKQGEKQEKMEIENLNAEEGKEKKGAKIANERLKSYGLMNISKK